MPTSLIIVIVILLVVILSVFLVFYKKLLKLNEHLNDILVEINSQLKKRSDLISPLLEILRKNLKNEDELIKAFSDLRPRLSGARSVSDSAQADKDFTEAFSYLIVISESNSNLKKNEAYQNLIFEFLSIEEKIQTARRAYNSGVKVLNTNLKKFPTNIVNKTLGHFEPRKLYELKEPKSSKKVK